MEPTDDPGHSPAIPQFSSPSNPTSGTGAASENIPLAAVAPPTLSPENLKELTTARAAMKKINRAAGTALFEGFSIAIFGGLSVLFQLNDIPNVIFGSVLVVIGIVEILTARGIRRLDEKSARNLALNQLVFALLILIYAGWNLYGFAGKGSGRLPNLSSDQELPANMDELLGGDDRASLENSVKDILYGGLIVAGVFEVGMAAYYHSRAKVIRSYIQHTPPWVIAMQKAGVAI